MLKKWLRSLEGKKDLGCEVEQQTKELAKDICWEYRKFNIMRVKALWFLPLINQKVHNKNFCKNYKDMNVN